MKKHTLILFTFLLSTLIFGQSNMNTVQNRIDKIILGKSTIPDVIKEFGTNYKLTTLENKNIREQYSGYEKNKGIIFSSLGLTFQCYDTTEIVTSITIRKPFVGKVGKDLYINFDKTKNKDVFLYYDSLEWTTTDASNYWSLSDENIKSRDVKITFYTSKDKSKPIYPLNEEEYNNRKFEYLVLSKPFFWYVPVKKINNLSYYKPLYALDSCENLNCLEYPPVGILKSIYYFFIYGEGHWPIEEKEGVWQDYYSNHILKSRGAFKDNKEVGGHKYFSSDGKLLKVIDYEKRQIYYNILSISGFILLIAFAILIIIRKKARAITRQ